MIVLGIETSCDETAAAVVSGKPKILSPEILSPEILSPEILSNVALSQLDEHAPYGGVVPEIAARAHLENISRVAALAMDRAGVKFRDLSGVAVTAGPGLIGGILVGLMFAKAIALSWRLPFMAVNHLEGHVLSVRLSDGVAFPYLVLLVSGGHCQLIAAKEVSGYRRLGSTLDDALGEAYDKIAKMLGLGFPGGPRVEKAALDGDPNRFKLPRPMKGRPGCNFSFSGLKTAVRHAAVSLLKDGSRGELKEGDTADLCASFQAAAADVLTDRASFGIKEFQASIGAPSALALVGGVAANQYLRQRLGVLAGQFGLSLAVPPLDLCTDNAAMIAWAGIERLRLGLVDGLDFAARPRWPLDPDAPPAAACF